MAHNEPTRENNEKQRPKESSTRGKPDFLVSTPPREEGESKEDFVLRLLKNFGDSLPE